MARDIEEFLRRAAERRKQQQGGKSTPQAPPQPQARQPQPPPPPPRPRVPQPIEPVEVVELTNRDIQRESVADHVQSHINTQDIASHAEHLGDKIAHVDENVERRLNKRFDRDLSALDERPSIQSQETSATVDPVSPIAEDLVDMLTNPKSIRQAILVNEIFKRPDFDKK